jgi:hypothetical protein
VCADRATAGDWRMGTPDWLCEEGDMAHGGEREDSRFAIKSEDTQIPDSPQRTFYSLFVTHKALMELRLSAVSASSAKRARSVAISPCCLPQLLHLLACWERSAELELTILTRGRTLSGSKVSEDRVVKMPRFAAT